MAQVVEKGEAHFLYIVGPITTDVLATRWAGALASV